MENERKDIFDRALEFLGNKWLEKHGIQGYAAKSVRTGEEEAPPGRARNESPTYII